MGKAKPVELPSKTFSTTGEATQFFKDMLGRYSNKHRDRINEKDSVLLYELLLRHPEQEQKIGAGVDYFYKDKNEDYPTRGFHLHRVDGSSTDFSYPTCIKGEKPSVGEYFYRACRGAVSDYLTREKNALLDDGMGICPETGELLTKDNSEYRHTSPTFHELLDSFKNNENLELSYAMFVDDADMQYGVKFLDSSIRGRFINYHRENANMELFKK
ncbi:DCL family protein [Ruficoccus sp. ZRK36]|uniref:DCL family protein n=1 Tax=Ruficoccus sp. ZRK36 TaxID=2866311 RepID=UPI001C730189|nr:DCL family protein [Ruficoccus sp. ZRK36]QYY34914.1 DCL family protein [Ruficoccus sp. ZRK36]